MDKRNYGHIVCDKRKDEKMTIFCERAKTRMKELYITARQMAKGIGMTESIVSRYLSGNRSPKIEELVKIAETLEYSADYLLGLNWYGKNMEQNRIIHGMIGMPYYVIRKTENGTGLLWK